MLIPTLWLKLKTVFSHLKPLHEVTTLHFSYEHVVYKRSVASLHNQAQFHFLYVRNASVIGILVV